MWSYDSDASFNDCQGGDVLCHPSTITTDMDWPDWHTIHLLMHRVVDPCWVAMHGLNQARCGVVQRSDKTPLHSVSFTIEPLKQALTTCTAKPGFYVEVVPTVTQFKYAGGCSSHVHVPKSNGYKGIN